MIFSRQIIYFFYLANTHSYGAAAELLHITESALRHAIHKLELYYNKKLFLRDKGSVILTSSGEYMYKKLYIDFVRMQNLSNRLREPRPQEIKITTDNFFYPLSFPKLKSLSVDNSCELRITRNPNVSFNQLCQFESDLIIKSYINELPPTPGSIFRIPLSTKFLGLLMHDRIFQKHKDAMRIIKTENIYQRSDAINQTMIDNLSKELKSTSVKCNFNFLPEILDVLNLVMSGEGVCFTTKEAIGNIELSENSLTFLCSPFNLHLALHGGIYLLKERYDELIEIALSIKDIFR